MKIIKYSTLLDAERKITLVKECETIFGSEKKLNSAALVVNMLNSVFLLDKQTEEYVYLIALDAACNPKGVFELTHGVVNASLVSPREIEQKMLLCNGVSYILAHNHPAGTSTPSAEDKTVYERLKKCGELMNTPLLDSIIVGDGCYYSFKENNEQFVSKEAQVLKKYEYRYFYRVEGRDGKKIVHIDGYFYKTGATVMLIQFCFLYQKPKTYNFKEENYKQYSGTLSAIEAYDYVHDAMELPLSAVDDNTPEGWYVDYEKGVDA